MANSKNSEEASGEVCSTAKSTNPGAYNRKDASRCFDIDHANTSFLDSMADKNAICLDLYINGFKELLKFFYNLGTIFSFVTSDLEKKITLLESYSNTEKGYCRTEYMTIQSVIGYETREDLLRDTKRQSGSRTILRLHRALEFLSTFMLNLSKLDRDAETSSAAREAYSNTLAKHHPWAIRTSASLALRTLPNKIKLIKSALGESAINYTLTDEKMLKLALVTKDLFQVVDKIYSDNNILNLP